ncbi:glycine-rich RNA-binding protein RZ1A [Diospyros lotus]|uniref:glycine-rich RNA-binding protein RZ1A n=1 Tax=Diospyros lotus TaxID=55363 RepID=UPI00224F36E8|nr:glycine-rich RNA-binding protein RZ1A [Diospyros lotus]
MTIDDENSVYVGGLPYEASEDSLRRVFDLYGHVIAVKIINDRGVGGKCYGFVTFTNPRSAIDAINDMDGRTIGGRVVRVNEVKSRGGRANFIREGFRRNSERGGWDRGRDHDRDYDRDKGRHWDRSKDRSDDHDQDRERGYDRGHDRTRDHSMDGDRDWDQDKDFEDNQLKHGRKRDRNWEGDDDLDGSQDKEMQRTDNHHKSGDKDKDQTSKKLNGLDFSERNSRELSSESSDDGHDEVQKQLGLSNQQLEELREQISKMEEMAEEKQQLVTKLQEKSQKLEDALTAAKKISSHHRMQLTKLHKSFLHVKDYNERLKNSEQELRLLVDSTTIEVDS